MDPAIGDLAEVLVVRLVLVRDHKQYKTLDKLREGGRKGRREREREGGREREREREREGDRDREIAMLTPYCSRENKTPPSE